MKIAQQTGFSIQDIAIWLEGFDTRDPLSERWEQMAKQKRSQLEEKKKQLNSMIQILDRGLSCKCLTCSECLEKIENTGSC
ncbi:MerR family DNA-binding protein [Brevibacillus sp. IT-7CA2]|uniref:MerR family DNA-binding protein n=1 Tax=Brevibacillus sp. IT-7CA2 TaxID=3026436 RepID=UPI0039E17E29